MVINLPILESKANTAKEEFFKIFNQTKISMFDKYIFFTKDKQFVANVDIDLKTLYCSHMKVWSIFQEQYQMDHEQISSFINKMFYDHFELNVSPY